MSPRLIVSNARASAHSEGEWTGHIGARITNCPCGYSYQGQQHRSDTGLHCCIEQAKNLVNRCCYILFIIWSKKKKAIKNQMWFKLPGDPIKMDALQIALCS